MHPDNLPNEVRLLINSVVENAIKLETFVFDSNNMRLPDQILSLDGTIENTVKDYKRFRERYGFKFKEGVDTEWLHLIADNPFNQTFEVLTEKMPGLRGSLLSWNDLDSLFDGVNDRYRKFDIRNQT